MLKTLDKHHPLGGPAWFNWSKLMLGILSPILLAVFWGGWSVIQTHIVVWTVVPAQVQENMKAVQKLEPKIDRVIELLEQHLKGEFTMTGDAVITDIPASPQPYSREGVWINELSPAICYKDQKEVKVTAVQDGRRTATMKILGTISIPDPSLLLEITSVAARDAYVTGESNRVPIILEPVKSNSNSTSE